MFDVYFVAFPTVDAPPARRPAIHVHSPRAVYYRPTHPFVRDRTVWHAASHISTVAVESYEEDDKISSDIAPTASRGPSATADTNLFEHSGLTVQLLLLYAVL